MQSMWNTYSAFTGTDPAPFFPMSRFSFLFEPLPCASDVTLDEHLTAFRHWFQSDITISYLILRVAQYKSIDFLSRFRIQISLQSCRIFHSYFNFYCLHKYIFLNLLNTGSRIILFINFEKIKKSEFEQELFAVTEKELEKKQLEKKWTTTVGIWLGTTGSDMYILRFGVQNKARLTTGPLKRF